MPKLPGGNPDDDLETGDSNGGEHGIASDPALVISRMASGVYDRVESAMVGIINVTREGANVNPARW